MTTDLMPFTYDGLRVRTLLIDGEPWFVLADLCTALGLTSTSRVAERLDPDGVSSAQVTDSLGRPQVATIVNEAGMYEVVIRSDKPDAIVFRRWVTRDVLPQIRKTGGFSSAPALTEEEIIQQGYALSMKRVEALTAEVAELKPKAEIADTYLTAQGGARLIREAAKLLDIREKDLRRFLLDEKLIFVKHAPCGNVQYDHYAQYAHHFKATEHIVRHAWGNCSHYTLTILPRGMELIAKRRQAVA